MQIHFYKMPINLKFIELWDYEQKETGSFQRNAISDNCKKFNDSKLTLTFSYKTFLN